MNCKLLVGVVFESHYLGFAARVVVAGLHSMAFLVAAVPVIHSNFEASLLRRREARPRALASGLLHLFCDLIAAVFG